MKGKYFLKGPAISSRIITESLVPEHEEFDHLRSNILNMVLLLACFLGTITYFSNIYSMVQTRSWVLLVVQTLIYASLIVLTVLEKIGFRKRSYGFLAIVYVLAFSDLVKSGLSGEGRLFLLFFALMALLLLEYRRGLLLFGGSILTIILIAGLMVSHILPAPIMTISDDSSQLSGWLTGGLVYGLVGALSLYSLFTLIRGLEKALGKQRQLSIELEEERTRLERRVAERTNELEQRGKQLELANQFGQEISELNSQSLLINRAVDYFQQKAGFNNLVVYMDESDSENYQAIAAAGEIGKSLQAKQFELVTNQPGTFGNLIRQGETRLLFSQGEDSLYFRSPLLTSVHLALLLPLKAGSRTIGALLLLTEEELDLNNNDLLIYQSMTNQLGIALEKTRLFTLMQKNVEALRSNTRLATQRSWRSYLQTKRRKFSYRYDQESMQTDVVEHVEAIQALKAGKPVITTIEADDTNHTQMVAVAVPIVLRNQPLGVINLRFTSKMVPTDMIKLIEAATKRLAISLENIRLMEEMQQRVEREHVISNISSRLRSSNDIDGILKAAASEIGRSMGVSEVLVQLRADE